MFRTALLRLAALLTLIAPPAFAADVSLLNVSFDPTRELYDDYNKIFAEHWKQKTGQAADIKQSHGGSAKQARTVMEGLPADVVTLALAYDIDMIAAKADLLPKDWQSRLPEASTPYRSTIVLLVRSGNPKGINGWDDLVKDGVKVITPNPKTGGGARWNYLAAWDHALKASGGKEEEAKAFMKKLFANVPVLDTGARGATTTFIERGIGDVLITWESEALLATKQVAKGKVEIVVPETSVLAEPPVAVLDKNAERRGTLEAAKEYLAYLYSPEAQRLVARHYYRPVNAEVLAEFRESFPEVKLTTIADFGGWEKTQQQHFAEGGIFDQIYAQ